MCQGECHNALLCLWLMGPITQLCPRMNELGKMWISAKESTRYVLWQPNRVHFGHWIGQSLQRDCLNIAIQVRMTQSRSLVKPSTRYDYKCIYTELMHLEQMAVNLHIQLTKLARWTKRVRCCYINWLLHKLIDVAGIRMADMTGMPWVGDKVLILFDD